MAAKKNFTDKYRIKGGQKVNLDKYGADDTAGFKSKKEAHKLIEKNLVRLEELQYLLFAENKRSLLVVLQAMDAGGKDGTVRHVMEPLNPASCKVTSFKTPTVEELSHDFLWRVHNKVPRKGEIGIFNRSHYEDVLIVKVQKWISNKVCEQRYKQINEFEKMLAENNVHIIKFFLHISKDEQFERLKARLDEPKKYWKINESDFEQRKLWHKYQKAYEEVLNNCSKSYAPWYIIPANKKWFRNLVVSQVLVEYLAGLKMKYPKPTCDISKLKEKLI